MQAKKNILITGASKGIGKAIAERLVLIKKYNVIGTTRNLKTITNRINGIRYVELDLSNSQSIDYCINEVGEIDILINNAGIVHIGPVEEMEEEKIRYLFEINFFGLVRITRTFVHMMRQKKEGLVINIGSLANELNLPFVSSYVASKCALAGFTESLRIELFDFGVKVVLIEPSSINSKMSSELLIKEDSIYWDKCKSIKEKEEENMLNSPSPEVVANLVNMILEKKKPKPIYYVGKQARLVIFLIKVLSNKIIEKAIRNYYKV